MLRVRALKAKRRRDGRRADGGRPWSANTGSALESRRVHAVGLPAGPNRHNGESVVEGQRMMQAAEDLLLGWNESRSRHRDFYVRQLFDVKGSVDLETVRPAGLTVYGEVCGATLARAHARSGDAAMIAGYISSGATFGKAMLAFAEAYADQTERDHAQIVAAITDGLIPAEEGI
ncbi:MAG: DUF2252 family protein [Ilumatobacteraceae bacterium]